MDIETVPAQSDTEEERDLTEELAQVTSRIAAKRRRLPTWVIGVLIFMQLYFLVSFCLPLLLIFWDNPILWIVLGGLILTPTVFLLKHAASSRTGPSDTTERRRRLIDKAVRQGDKRALGVMLMMLRHDQGSLESELNWALCALLPLVDQMTDLTVDEREALAYVLRFSSNADLVQCALQCVDRAQLCSPVMIYTVRSLSRDGRWRNTRIQELACAVLLRLEATARIVEQPAILLRASAREHSRQETLLRATGAPLPETAPHELLRSVETETPSPSRSTVLCEPAETSDVLQRSSHC